MSCKNDSAPLLVADLPPAYLLPDGVTLSERVALGTTLTLVYDYRGDVETLRGQIKAQLEASPWRFEATDDGFVSRGPGFKVTVRASASGDASQLYLEVVKGSTPAPRRAPILDTPPSGYPKGFPFVKGGRLHQQDGSTVEIDYDELTRGQLAKRLRDGAEAMRWMCTQGDKRFLCAVGGRNVDVLLWRKGTTLRLEISELARAE